MNIIKTLIGTPQYVSRTDTTANSPEPNPNDIWIFTDPDARDRFAKVGKIQELAHDIQYEVMRGESWLPEELEYKKEIRRLLREGTIVDKGSYWYASPFPTVYRAVRSGLLDIKYYHNALIDSDLSLHLKWETEYLLKNGSETGLKLVSGLEEFGRVRHSIWQEEDLNER